MLHCNRPFFSPHANHALAISFTLPLADRGTGFSPVISPRARTRKLGSALICRRRNGIAARPESTILRNAGCAIISVKLDVVLIPNSHSETKARYESSETGEVASVLLVLNMGRCPFITSGNSPTSSTIARLWRQRQYTRIRRIHADALSDEWH